MSHTNSTTNYNLPQFVGTDKPTWLNDVNGAMSAIDTQMKANADTATSASTTATSAQNAVGNLSNLTTTAKTDTVSAINEVNTNVGTAQETANGAVTTANSAYSIASTIENALNLNTTSNLTWTSNIGTISTNTTKTIKNSTGSIAKIYGHIVLTNSASSTGITLTSSDTGLRPESAISFHTCGQLINTYDYVVSGQHLAIPYQNELIYTLNTDGTITISIVNNPSYIQIEVYLYPVLLLISDFGD